MNIKNMMTLSTVHIKENSCRFLNEQYFSGNLLVVYRKEMDGNVFGWFVLVEGWDDDDEENILKIPEDLRFCLEFATEKNCSWLMFDGDCDECDELPKYEME